jgi:hypothetical protein
MTVTSKPTRTETARHICNRALLLVRNYGCYERVGDQYWLTWRGAGFIVSHRAPSQRLDDPGVARETKRHPAGAPEPLPYGLEIHQGRKVLNLEWSDDELVIVNFRRGTWENVFLERPTLSGVTPMPQHMTLQ